MISGGGVSLRYHKNSDPCFKTTDSVEEGRMFFEGSGFKDRNALGPRCLPTADRLHLEPNPGSFHSPLPPLPSFASFAALSSPSFSLPSPPPSNQGIEASEIQSDDKPICLIHGLTGVSTPPPVAACDGPSGPAARATTVSPSGLTPLCPHPRPRGGGSSGGQNRRFA